MFENQVLVDKYAKIRRFWTEKIWGGDTCFREKYWNEEKLLERAKSFAMARLFEARVELNPWRPHEARFSGKCGKSIKRSLEVENFPQYN